MELDELASRDTIWRVNDTHGLRYNTVKSKIICGYGTIGTDQLRKDENDTNLDSWGLLVQAVISVLLNMTASKGKQAIGFVEMYL